MTLENWAVAGAILLALAYLGYRAYRRYQKEARQLQACQSCPVVKERLKAGVKPPPPSEPSSE